MRIIGAAFLILIVTSAAAEERCLPADTPRQCVQRLIATREYEKAQAALASANTGSSTVASPVRSAVKDFLSAASADVDGSSVKDNGTALIIDYNFMKQFNLEATFADPVPSPAAASVAATTPSTAVKVEQLSRGDDVLTTLSFNLLTRRFGRDIDRSLFNSMLLSLISNTAPATASVPTTAYDTPFEQLFPDAAARLTAMAEYETAAIAALPAAAQQIEKDLADFENRQPQLFVSALYHRRAPEIGPDTHGFRLTWEIGNDNINTFRSAEGRDCEQRGDCLATFTSFAARMAKRSRSGRLALAIQYGKTALNNSPDLPYTEVATNYFTYMATYGQEISSFTGKPARLDLSFTFDGTKTTHGLTAGTTSSPQRAAPAMYLNLNSIPSLLPSTTPNSTAFTITQPVGGNFSVPISVVSVSHDDWVPKTNCSGTNATPIVNLPISFPLPETVPCAPAHRRHREREYHLSIRYQLPSFSRPPQNPCCCCM